MNFSLIAKVLDSFSDNEARAIHVPTILAAASAVGIAVPKNWHKGIEELFNAAPPGMSVSDYVSTGAFAEKIFANLKEGASAPPPTMKRECVSCGNFEEVVANQPYRCIKCGFLQLAKKAARLA